MFDIVFKQLLEDQQRSDRSILYAQHLGNPMYGAISQAYDVFTKNLDPEYLADTTNAISITDGIYVQMGVELGL
jgi:hypothetical protein